MDDHCLRGNPVQRRGFYPSDCGAEGHGSDHRHSDYEFGIGICRFGGVGPAGAALGTTLSQALSVLIALLAIRKRRMISLQKSDLRPQKAVMGQILRIGLPVLAQDGLVQIGFLIITIIANQRGLTDAAAVGIVEKFISFVFLVPSSLLSTVSALAAQNLGADKPERARQTLWDSIALALGFGVVAAIAITALQTLIK